MRPAPTVSVLLLLAGASFNLPASAALQTHPASRPALAQLLARLDDPSADKRADAFRSLLTLSRADLPELLSTLKAAAPLSRAAVDQLRLAVTHIYLSEEPFEYVEGGALGITLDEINLPGSPSDDGAERSAILVMDCRPGFAAYRYLEPGDIIVGISGVQDKFDRSNFGGIIKRTGANHPITLQVIRRGKGIEVTVILSHRPPWIDALRDPLYDAAWLKTGDDYWNATFAPVVHDVDGVVDNEDQP